MDDGTWHQEALQVIQARSVFWPCLLAGFRPPVVSGKVTNCTMPFAPEGSALPEGNTLGRHASVIALVTVLPAWLSSWLVLSVFPKRPAASTWSEFVVGSGLLLLALCVIACFSVVQMMARRGRFRSDQCWSAGGWFVAVVALIYIVVTIVTAGGDVFIALAFLLYSGHLLIIFVLGSLSWLHFAPHSPPLDWMKPRDPLDE